MGILSVSEEGDVAAVHFLLEHGVHVDIQDYVSAFLLSSIFKCLSFIATHVHDVLQKGSTALMIASENGHSAVVEALLQHDAQVNFCVQVSILVYPGVLKRLEDGGNQGSSIIRDHCEVMLRTIHLQETLLRDCKYAGRDDPHCCVCCRRETPRWCGP